VEYTDFDRGLLSRIGAAVDDFDGDGMPDIALTSGDPGLALLLTSE
jgi:hypothetical protein